MRGAVLLTAIVLVGCTGDDGARRGLITVPDLTGLSRDRAVGLVGQLDLDIRIEEIDITEIDSLTPSPGTVAGGQFAGDAVLRQEPVPNTRVEPGATLILFVPAERLLRAGEERLRLLTHCGLSYPLTYQGQRWLPVERRFRRTHNPPEGFHSDGYYDRGFIQKVDEDTLIYTSSTGIAVEYEPTKRREGGCD